MHTNNKLKQMRKAQGMTADELGAVIGKDRSTIYRYEQGNIGNAPVNTIPLLAKALQTTPSHLLGWDEMPLYSYIHRSDTDVLSTRADQWFAWTGGYLWSDEEMAIFTECAKFLMSKKDAADRDAHLTFLLTFFQQLTK